MSDTPTPDTVALAQQAWALAARRALARLLLGAPDAPEVKY
jgi:hypothetical protein